MVKLCIQSSSEHSDVTLVSKSPLEVSELTVSVLWIVESVKEDGVEEGLIVCDVTISEVLTDV